MTKKLDWQVKSFTQLTTDELYDLLKFRIDVFVVEQECYYPDLDNIDREPNTLHIFNYQDGKITSYCRVLAQV
jgi:ElaA protein